MTESLTRKLVLLLLILHSASMKAQPQYTKGDSVRVVSLLREARAKAATTNWMLFFGRKLRGVPYVAKTLEKNKKERLVVNLRQLDCTTFVETTLALTLCAQKRLTHFSDYLAFLRLIRYRNGEVAYQNRLHYFTEWIIDNSRMGYVKEISMPNPPFTAVQKIRVGFMTSHTELYPMMHSDSSMTAKIRRMEQGLNGREYPFIPKNRLNRVAKLRKCVNDGDIIAILTSKKGLDTQHIGIAVWHKDGLHLLNASQIRKRVVEEPMTLYTYMQRHPSQTGIRVLRVGK